MTVFYTGMRPVLKGRNSNDAVHPNKGVVGTYSNWSLFNTSHVLDGAPNNNHVPGEGRHPHGISMSRRYNGLETHSSQVEELRAAGGGVRITGMRYRPLENKAAGNNLAFISGYGHIDRETSYSLVDHYDDTNRQVQISDPGHVRRGVDAANTANSFGAFDPHIYKGVPTGQLDDAGSARPTGYDNSYGKNRVLEWRGVTSARIL